MAKSNLAHIEEIFHVALSYDPVERQAYLERVCAGDAAIRREVESLVAAHDSGSVLDQNAVTLAMRVIGTHADDSMVGQEVGVYRILNRLGEGGMGTVYLAEDSRLNRKVALKFLSSDFISDSWAKRQLIREAQAVAMLDHPNICAVYGFEEIGEHSFIVMQYIEGETLADLIHDDGLKNEQILTLAQQIVSALGSAHAHGIIHRDIKPKNIMVTPTGQVKVLDFGLAKTMHMNLEDATESISNLSREGLLVGTVAYMSPEQLRGDRLDYRSDIFSLGTVLYEMACGRNPYAHQTNAETISAIMSREPPPLRQVSFSCPKGLDPIVRRCIQKDRAERYQSAAELLIDLENIQKGISLPSPPAFLKIRYAAVALILVVVSVFIYEGRARTTPTLAVLPITCEGMSAPCVGPSMTENLVRALTQHNGIHVASSEKVPSLYGPNAASPQKVGQALSADIVLFGRITQGEKGPVLTIRLERVTDSSQIVEEPILLTGKPGQIEQFIAFEVATWLRLPMNDADRNLFYVLAAQQNQNANAVTLNIQGRLQWENRDIGSLETAIDSFKRAIDADPLYAKAWAGLADTYVLMNTAFFHTEVSADAPSKAEYAANKALEIDDNLAEAHTAKAAVLMKLHWDWSGAEREFKRAIALAPDYSPARWGYSNLLVTTGRFDEAISESERARDLDPFHPPAQLNYCRTLYFARRFDQAYPCYDRLVVEFPNYAAGKYAHSIVDVLRGRFDEAIPVFQQMYDKDKAVGGAMLGYTYAVANRRKDAQQILTEMQAWEKEHGLPPQEIAIIYLGLDDLDHAIPLFRKAVEDRYPPSQAIFVDVFFDKVRTDPRFADVARNLKLPALPTSGAAAASYLSK